MVQELRAALYGRVSTEEQVEGYSLDAQRRAFQALVEGRGWTVFQEYLEEGRSAHTDDVRKRPMFKRAVDDAIAGKYDVLVVHKIDRFSRKLRITLEYFERLGKAGVGFVSIQNEMDYSTPTGKFMLVMQGGLAELYSDNLSEETKKGLAERKAQGLYCGPLSFGAMKSENGVPVPDPDSYPGLSLAFEMAAEGKTDGEVAQALNTKGYRTVGTRGSRPLAKHSVRGMLTNRFYLGELPDGNGGWTQGKHESFIDQDQWDRVQAARQRNRTSTHSSRPNGKRTWSLTGLTFCWQCKGHVHSQYVYKGQPRLGCYNRQQGRGCEQKSANSSVYEVQLEAYLAAFHVPEDYQERILDYHRKLEAAYDDAEQMRAVLEARLRRLRELYEWGDCTKAEYETRKADILKQLEAIAPTLDKLAQFLSDVPAAWEVATQEQRNKLARTLFDEVWVKPRPELEPFFQLNYQESEKIIEGGASRRVELPVELFCARVKGDIDMRAESYVKRTLPGLCKSLVCTWSASVSPVDCSRSNIVYRIT
jgi:site-specific DNA recombinase